MAPDGVAVLNATDPMVAAMAEDCPGTVTFFGADGHHPVMATHRAQGRRVVYVDGDAIVAAEGSRRQRIPLSEVPLTRNGTIGFQVENAMAAIGAAWAVGLDWEHIRAGLRVVRIQCRQRTRALQRLRLPGATLIADYGHNPDAMAALVSAVETIQATARGRDQRRGRPARRRSPPQTRILGDAFDEIILYPGHVPARPRRRRGAGAAAGGTR